MEEIAKALELKNQLDNLRPIDKEKEAIIMQKFRLDWNYHSNHLEGNSLTYGETKALILFGITAQGKPLKDTLEITGHNEAINWVLDLVKGERPLTENFIRELHSLLLQDLYKESKNAYGVIVPRKISAGKYKTTTNHVETVTREIFYFATPEETPAKMHDLLNWYNLKTKEENVNPILVAAQFHYRFIRIHPFDDGNGRTARILMNFILMQFGFPPVIIKTEDKANYFAALQMADAGNIETFINYIAQNLNRSLEIMIAGAQGESIEEDDDLDKEIALLGQRLKFADQRLMNKFDNLSISLIELIDKFYSSQSKFKKLYKFYNFKLYIDNQLFEYDRNNILNYLSNSLSKKHICLEICLIYNFSSFFYWDDNEEEYTQNLELKFSDYNYSIKINQAITFEKKQLQSLNKKEINLILTKLNEAHKDFIEQKTAEKENK